MIPRFLRIRLSSRNWKHSRNILAYKHGVQTGKNHDYEEKMRRKNIVPFHKDFEASDEIFSQYNSWSRDPETPKKMLCSGTLFKATFKLKIIPLTNLNVSKLREFTQTVPWTIYFGRNQSITFKGRLPLLVYIIYLGCLAFFPSVSSWLVAKWTFRPSFNMKTYIAQEPLNSVADPDTNIY